MEITLKTTKEQQFINITSNVRDAVKNSGIKDGLVCVFVPHTTAGITINENADADVVRDMIVNLDKAFPKQGDYLHIEGNSHAHIKASLMGNSCSVIIENGELKLGRWQGIYFCEFDGPRTRKIFIKILNG